MGIEKRNRTLLHTQQASEWTGVVREYVGTGLIGELAVVVDARRCAERVEKRATEFILT